MYETLLYLKASFIEKYPVAMGSFVTSAFAFYFFSCLAGYIAAEYIIVTEVALTQINFGLSWSNFFINVLTVLVISEISSYIAKAYWDYRGDNL